MRKSKKHMVRRDPPPIELCVVCAQAAGKLKCSRCKTPYCSLACQTLDWKERAHKKACKRQVKVVVGGASSPAPPRTPAPKTKADPPVVASPYGAAPRGAVGAAAPGRRLAAAGRADGRRPGRCPVCLEDWDVNVFNTMLLCCCEDICDPCGSKLIAADLKCPLCRTPRPRGEAAALAMLRANVERGNAEAMHALGDCAATGTLGMKPSQKRAAELFRRAADLGNASAMVKIGGRLWTGEGVRIDRRKARAYLRRAADRGDPRAQHRLADCLEGDDAEAYRLCGLAAEQGYTEAEHTLAAMYTHGYGVAKNYAEAIRWYKRAMAKGDAGARDALVRLHRALRAREEEFAPPRSTPPGPGLGARGRGAPA